MTISHAVYEDDGPGVTFCLECSKEIPDADDMTPYCAERWKKLEEEGFFEC